MATSVSVYESGWQSAKGLSVYESGWQTAKGLWVYESGWTQVWPPFHNTIVAGGISNTGFSNSNSELGSNFGTCTPGTDVNSKNIAGFYSNGANIFYELGSIATNPLQTYFTNLYIGGASNGVFNSASATYTWDIAKGNAQWRWTTAFSIVSSDTYTIVTI